jgi:hypothetical protein
MGKIDPTKFIVRAINYPQDTSYAEQCAEITEQLLDEKPKSANDFLVRVSELLKEKAIYKALYGRDTPDYALDEIAEKYASIRGFDKPGMDATTHIPVKSRYNILAEDFLEANPEQMENIKNNDMEKQITATTRDGREVNLSRIMLSTNARGYIGGKINHPYAESSWDKEKGDMVITSGREHDHEHLWSMISQNFLIATNEKEDKQTRKEAAILFYASFSHDMPLTRGSATAARIGLEYLANSIGFEVPFFKEGADPNLKAIARTPDQFLKDFMIGNMFDKTATPQSVLDWQEIEIGRQETHKKITKETQDPATGLADTLAQIKIMGSKVATSESTNNYYFTDLINQPKVPSVQIRETDQGHEVTFSLPHEKAASDKFVAEFIDNYAGLKKMNRTKFKDTPEAQSIKEAMTGGAVLNSPVRTSDYYSPEMQSSYASKIAKSRIQVDADGITSLQ